MDVSCTLVQASTWLHLYLGGLLLGDLLQLGLLFLGLLGPVLPPLVPGLLSPLLSALLLLLTTPWTRLTCFDGVLLHCPDLHPFQHDV